VNIEQEKWTEFTQQYISRTWFRHPVQEEYNPVGYFKDSLGIVHLRGVLQNIALGAQREEEIFRLPEGYRPASRELHIVFVTDVLGTAAFARVDITKDGAVRVINPAALGVGASPPWLSLDGITFRAAG